MGAIVGSAVGASVGENVQYCGHLPGHAMPNVSLQLTLNTIQRGSSSTPLQKTLVGADDGAAVGVPACLRARSRAFSIAICASAVSVYDAPWLRAHFHTDSGVVTLGKAVQL